jgi:probable HAF family extracellular repeat protein
MGFSVFHVYLWEDGVFQDLGTLGGTRALGWDINESGAIAGESWTGGVPGGAFLWKDGSMINLGTLGGGGSEAFGLNDAEQVVGCAQRLEGNFCHAFLWENGEMTDIGALGGFASSQAKAINNHGQVVGGPSFLYEPDTGMADLHDLIPADSGWSSLSPRDLNDSGQIVGYGYVDGHGRAFLMNPLPAPLSPRPRSVHMGNGIALRLGINRRDAHHCAVLNLIGRAACTHIHGFVIPLEPSPLR